MPETVLSSPGNYVASYRLSNSWHTYGFQWYVDGEDHDSVVFAIIVSAEHSYRPMLHDVADAQTFSIDVINCFFSSSSQRFFALRVSSFCETYSSTGT